MKTNPEKQIVYRAAARIRPLVETSGELLNAMHRMAVRGELGVVGEWYLKQSRAFRRKMARRIMRQS